MTPLVKCITMRVTPFVRYVYVMYFTMRMTPFVRDIKLEITSLMRYITVRMISDLKRYHNEGDVISQIYDHEVTPIVRDNINLGRVGAG